MRTINAILTRNTIDTNDISFHVHQLVDIPLIIQLEFPLFSTDVYFYLSWM